VKIALIELHYLPCIAYFSALSSVETVVVEKYEHYEKQTFRNRCYIMGPHRLEPLIVPVQHAHGKAPMHQIRIDYSQKWLNGHWRTIKTGYGNAPFFEYYAPDLHDVMFRKPPFLYDLNLELMTLCLKWLHMKPVVRETRTYDEKTERDIIDLRGVINPKKEGGCNRIYKSIEYQQVFGSKFVPNLSLIDLIFSQGPGSWDVVKASAVNEQ